MQQTLWLNSRWLNSGWAPLVRLLGCLAVIAVVWLGILPFLGRQPVIDAYIRRNEQLGIDPSAKFYTELPAAPDLVERVKNRLLAVTQPADF